MNSCDENSSLSRFLAEWRSDSQVIEAHSSGSTGKPKRILLPKADMKVSAEATCRFFRIDADSLLFLPLSLDYIAGKMMAVRSEVSGARLILEKPSNSPLQNEPPGIISLGAIVPSQVPGLLASPWSKKVKTLIIGGAPLSAEYEDMIMKSDIEAYATYGMTETCSHVALRRLGQDRYKALPHVSFETDSRGCLVVISEAMSFKRLVTNDIVNLIDDHNFIWRGRYDNVINSGGIKVFPEVVESKIAQALNDRVFYITSRKSHKWGEEVVLMVEGAEALTENQLKALDLLKPAERPKAIIFEASFKFTLSGKIIRKKPV